MSTDLPEPQPAEHPFAPFVRIIGRGKRARRDFTRDEAAASMTAILGGQATDAQIGAWLMLLRVKEESPEELAGFVDACRAHVATHVGALPDVDLDWPSYAGKKKHAPWFLLAALRLSQTGVRVLMHGGPAHTPGRLYTDQALEALGVPLARTVDAMHQQLATRQFCYVGLDVLCPPLATLLTLRFELGLRSPINTLARCLNPAQAPLSLQSVFHPAYIRLQQGAATLLNEKDLLIFKGEGGEVEIRPDAETRLYGLAGGEAFESTWASCLPRQTVDTTPSADQLVALWRDDSSDAYGALAVVHTMAVVLRHRGTASSDAQALEMAQALWAERDRNSLP